MALNVGQTLDNLYSDSPVFSGGEGTQTPVLIGLVIQLAEAGHPAVYPVFLRPVGGQLDGQHVVGGVSRGGQGPSAGAGFVHRTNVDVFVQKLGHLSRFEQDDGQRVEEDLGQRLSDDHVLSVPARPLDKKTLDVGAVLRLLGHVGLFFGDLEHKSDW